MQTGCATVTVDLTMTVDVIPRLLPYHVAAVSEVSQVSIQHFCNSSLVLL